MVQLIPNQASSWVLVLISALWVAGSTAQSAAPYPNPWAPKPSQAPQQPLAGQPGVQQPGAIQPSQSSQPASDYPNPFASQPTGGSGQPSASSGYPNPFVTGGGSGGSGGSSGGYPNPFVTGGGTTGKVEGGQNAASLDPANAAGTCCCDPKKTFSVANPPPPAGGCCAKGNKWGCSCQDGGSFAHNPLACPILHRNTRITPSGPKFELYCNVQTHRANIKVEPADSFIECVDSCGATAGCVGVDFAKTTKQCFLKSEYMTEESEGAANNDVDSASMPPLACPDIDGEIRNIDGISYKLFCTKPVTTSSHATIAGANTVELCAKRCSADPRCQGFNFRPSDKGCFHHYIYQNPPLGNEVGFVTLVPVTQR